MSPFLVPAAIQVLLVAAIAGHGTIEAFTVLDGLPVAAAWTSSLANPRSTSSLPVKASSLLLANGSCILVSSPLYRGKNVGARGGKVRGAILSRQTPRVRGNTPATGESAQGSGQSVIGSREKSRITVRQAKERDYQGVADIRGVIVPVGMSGATGFLGGRVVIDDPAEAKRRLLMAKVADLVSGEAAALIALDGKRIVGTVDCILQPVADEMEAPRQQRQQLDNVGGESAATMQLFLKNLFVLPDTRRRGVARELVKGAEAFARKNKARIICLDVARKNTAARQLYSSCGFKEMERPGPVEGGMGGALLKSLGMGKRYMIKTI